MRFSFVQISSLESAAVHFHDIAFAGSLGSTSDHVYPQCPKPSSHHRSTQNVLKRKHLVSSTAGLGDDTLELINLGLGAAEGTKTLLCELASTLVLGVAEQLNDAALVWCKTIVAVSIRSMCGMVIVSHTQKPP